MITVYSKQNCPHCDMAMKILEEKGVSYTVKKIDESTEARSFLIEEGHRTVPQIYKDGKLFVKNYRELQNMDKDTLSE